MQNGTAPASSTYQEGRSTARNTDADMHHVVTLKGGSTGRTPAGESKAAERNT